MQLFFILGCRGGQGPEATRTPNLTGTPQAVVERATTHSALAGAMTTPSPAISEVSSHSVDSLKDALMFNSLDDIRAAVKSNPRLITKTNKDGDTLLHKAAFWGHLEMVEYLVAEGAKINVHGDSNKTPLHNASFMGHSKIVKFLISKGAELNSEGHIGRTPIHGAVSTGKVDVVKILIGSGADLSATNSMDNTPLHVAVDLQNAELVTLLLENKADPNVIGFQGQHTLQMTQDDKIKEILLKHGAKQH